MVDKGLNRIFWGFFFILVNININNFDMVPDIAGFIFFAFAFKDLEEYSTFFKEAFKYNGYLIIISALSIFNVQLSGDSIMTAKWLIMFAVFVVSLVLRLKMVYSLFMGLKEMHNSKFYGELAAGAEERWQKYKTLIILNLFTFVAAFIPLINIMYILALLVISIIYLVNTLRYINSCRDAYSGY